MSNVPSTPPPVAPQTGDATGGVIPYKNPHALTAYYLGVFSVIPMLGFLFGCVAVPLGISGLRKRRAAPVIRGAVHAWVGIALGGLSVLVHFTFVLLAVIGASQR